VLRPPGLADPRIGYAGHWEGVAGLQDRSELHFLPHALCGRGGLKAVNPGLALTVFGGAASCSIAIHFGVHGPNETNAMSCASGAIGLGRGLQAVRSGEADHCARRRLRGAASPPVLRCLLRHPGHVNPQR